MAKVSNNTQTAIYASVEGINFEVLAGGSLEVTARQAMLLAEYGLSIDRPKVEAELARQAQASRDVVGEDPTVERVTSASTKHADKPTPRTAAPAVPAMPGTPTGEFVSSSGASEPPDAEQPNADEVPTPSEEADLAAVADLKGEALDAALVAKGLPTSGKADEKRARLAAVLSTERADAAEKARAAANAGT